MIKLFVNFFCIAILSAACHNNPRPLPVQQHLTVFVVQPFSGMPEQETDFVYAELQKIYPRVKRNQQIDLPLFAYHAARKRYRADSLINYLKSITPAGHTSIGLTNTDISTTKDNIADWGVMGLGFCPGSACVASEFRLSVKDREAQLFKVAVHELGHTQGLPHCPAANCFMKDAAGRNATNELNGFCQNCEAVLTRQGWIFR